MAPRFEAAPSDDALPTAPVRVALRMVTPPVGQRARLGRRPSPDAR